MNRGRFQVQMTELCLSMNTFATFLTVERELEIKTHNLLYIWWILRQITITFIV